VKLRHLPGSVDQVIVAEKQPRFSAQHVQPLMALMGLRLRGGLARRDEDLPRLHPSGLWGEWNDGAAVHPAGLQPRPRVADIGGADQLVERNPVRLGEREQQLQAWPALTGLQPRQGALRNPGRLR
jgi:hypothetical protein